MASSSSNFNKSSSATSATSEQQAAYLNQMRSNIQSQMMQDLVNQVTENCFKLCAGQRGTGLDSNEKQCIAYCVGRYFDTVNVVHESVASKQLK